MAVIGNAPATTGTIVSAQSFNGDASTVAFTLNRSVNSTVDLEVLVDNVQQSPYDGSYSVSGTTLTFSSAPASGTNNVYVIYRGATIQTAQVVPDDGSVSAAKIQSNAVTVDKLNGGSVEGLMTTQFGRRNLIINGAMQVAQRGTTFDFASSNGAFTLDRFFWQNIRDDQLETRVTQDSNAPTGFFNSLKVVATTAESAWDVDEFARFIYKIEAQDLQQLDYGASTAKTITMSFWVKSDVASTYSVSLYVPDADRRLGSTYTINTADTWEYKTITFVGDTAGTGINNDNGEGIQISFCLAAGSNYTGTNNTTWLANSDAATFYGHTATWGTTINDYWQITGIQLEVGSVATPFEHRSYGEELALCQRYFFSFDVESNLFDAYPMWAYGNNALSTRIRFPTTMRTAPTATITGTIGDQGTDWSLYNNSGWRTLTLLDPSQTTKDDMRIDANVSSGVTGTDAAGLYNLRTNGGGTLTVDAEL